MKIFSHEIFGILNCRRGASLGALFKLANFSKLPNLELTNLNLISTCTYDVKHSDHQIYFPPIPAESLFQKFNACQNYLL